MISTMHYLSLGSFTQTKEGIASHTNEDLGLSVIPRQIMHQL